VRRALLVASAVAALAACGGAEPAGTATELTITVVPDEGAQANVMTLTCDPPGGDHPDAEAACDSIEQAGGADAFRPFSDEAACTMIYGGPQTAAITGTYRGDDVDAEFSRRNGCEISRWDALGTEVFDVPLQ
jgi:hypothetical protein